MIVFFCYSQYKVPFCTKSIHNLSSPYSLNSLHIASSHPPVIFWPLPRRWCKPWSLFIHSSTSNKAYNRHNFKIKTIRMKLISGTDNILFQIQISAEYKLNIGVCQKKIPHWLLNRRTVLCDKQLQTQLHLQPAHTLSSHCSKPAITCSDVILTVVHRDFSTRVATFLCCLTAPTSAFLFWLTLIAALKIFFHWGIGADTHTHTHIVC